MNQLIKKLNEHQNFHLSLKGIEFSEKSLIDEFLKVLKEHNHSYKIINHDQDIFEQLLDAYQQKVDYVLYENISILLPLIKVITNENISSIKPIIPVYYCLKDNKLIQQVKTLCNKTYTTYHSFKNYEELLEAVYQYIS